MTRAACYRIERGNPENGWGGFWEECWGNSGAGGSAGKGAARGVSSERNKERHPCQHNLQHPEFAQHSSQHPPQPFSGVSRGNTTGPADPEENGIPGVLSEVPGEGSLSETPSETPKTSQNLSASQGSVAPYVHQGVGLF